ncbi:DNA-directed RNA polymerase I subunit rpa49 [Paramarasmius palmivorus]|uniref:DNA-directed RNA polymerase I subunit rpa49 n=1 Tax=Paramarasmius palmivorus TaxID=297713 RepID=A0AAW0D079_9AGAR
MPSVNTSNSKKRKREVSPERDGVSVKVAESSKAGALGPLLVSFPALQAPNSTVFKCYAPDGQVKEGRMDVVGETPDVEFVSHFVESQRAASSGCRYMLAVHNRKTSSLTLLPESKTPHILTRTVKALKANPDESQSTSLAYREARNALGETFGTKKAKAAIRAEERNRVDVGAMQGVMQHVMSGIEKGAENLMTTEEAKEIEDSNRPIPRFNDRTDDPAEVYPLHNIIPEAEWKVISTSEFDNTKTLKEMASLLPMARPEWIQSHLKALENISSPKAARKTWKVVYYVSALFQLRWVLGRKGMSKDSIHQKMNRVPTIIVDGLLSRFTETTRDSSATHTLTSGMETKLLSYMLALCLRADGYSSNPEVIAKDLSLAATRVNELFKNLGCKIKKLSDTQLAKLGLSKSLQDTKMAVLTAPLEFPKVSRGKKGGR